MRAKHTRALALFIAVLLIFSLVPFRAWAGTPEVSEGRAQNEVRFNPNFKFWNRWIVGNRSGSEYFVVPFDTASGAVMFCVDPGVPASTNPKNYTLYVGAGGSELDGVMALAQGDSKLQYTLTGMKPDPEGGITSEALENLADTDMEAIVKLISVLHYYAGEGISGAPQHGELYNIYDVFAVQCYIWFACNPNSPGQWYPISNLSAAEQEKVINAFNMIAEKANELYTNSEVQPFVLDTGTKAKESQAQAERLPVLIDPDAGTGTYTVTARTKAEFAKIKYITLDGSTVRAFGPGATVTSGAFSITNNGDGLTASITGEPDGTVYSVQFLTSETIPEAAEAGEDWAIYAQAGSRYQSYFTTYQAPTPGGLFLSFQLESPDPHPWFPEFAFSQRKYDAEGGFDGYKGSPMGDTSLAAGFELTYTTDKGSSGSKTATANNFGEGSSMSIAPWDSFVRPSDIVTETVETAMWPEESEEGGEGEAGEEPVEYIKSYTWEGTCTVTVRESAAPEGHDGTAETFTHTISYYAHTERESPTEEFSDIAYTILVDGRDTGLTTSADIRATWDAPYQVNASAPDTFTNEGWTGTLQIIKTRDSDDIFSEEHGQGTMAGGSGAGKEYSTGSKWTVRLVSGGYEGWPYIRVAEDTAMQSGSIGTLMHCYKVMLDGSGTPADEEHPLTPSQFGQIYISNLPYGTYLVTEYRADEERYVLESFYVTIDQPGQIRSLDVNNTAKQNVVTLVKVDSETGKTVPAAGTAFRIRYLGSPDYADPTQTPNYGRYLPNASDLTASVADPNDYLFYTDGAGMVTIPYMLPYGNYQVEEILVPEGYYIGRYGQDGVAEDAEGSSGFEGSDGQSGSHEAGDGMEFVQRVAIYDAEGHRIDYTNDGRVVYNYYTFSVTEQADHVDGNGYETYYLTVELANTAVKGKLEMTALGERLAGFRETADQYGNVVHEPVYERLPLSGVTFGVYAAEDVLLADGEEPPRVYDKLTGRELTLTTDVLHHVQYPQSEIVKTGVHESSGAEIIQRIERGTADQGEHNYAYVDYLTPTRQGVTYTLSFSRYDGDAGLTYAYEAEFGLEYAAGGVNYTDIKVLRTVTADDYVAEISDALPVLRSGGAAIDYSAAQTLDNGNRVEVLPNELDGGSYLINEYDYSVNDYEVQRVEASSYQLLTPAIPAGERWARMEGLPELPEGYRYGSILPNYVTVTNGVVGQEMAAVYVTVPPEVEPAQAPDLFRLFSSRNAPEGEETRTLEWRRLDSLGELEGFDPATDYYVPRYSLEGIAITGVNGEALDFADYGYEGVTPAYATGSTLYVTVGADTETVYAVYYTGEQALDGTVLSIDAIELVAEGEEPGFGAYDGPDPAGYPLPEGYAMIGEAFGPIMAYNAETDASMVFVKEGEEYRWISCDETGSAVRVRQQAFRVRLAQPPASPEGWRFEMDGIVLTNTAAVEGGADAVIAVPYEGATFRWTESVGCEVVSEELPGGGTETTVAIRQPEAPVYFEMIDGSRVEMVYLGGYTKTTVTVPAAAPLPVISYGGAALDYFDRANGGLTPDRPDNELTVAGDNLIRVVRHDAETAAEGAYYVIEIISDSTSMDEAHFVVDHHGGYQSVPLVITDGETGAGRGDLRFSSLYRTLRYPVSTLVETITTDDRGVAVSSLLPLGRYVLRELETAEGFVASDTAYELALTYEDQYTPLVWASASMENNSVGIQLDITKGFQQNGTEYVPAAGAVFGVYTGQRITADGEYTGEGAAAASAEPGTLVATVTTGEDGKALETIKLPAGEYYVRELSTLPGYELNDTRFRFRVDDALKSGALTFDYEDLGVTGKITHSGYKTAQVEIGTYTQIPALTLTVNGLDYDLSQPLAEGTVGDNALVSNVVDPDRSVFTVTAAAGAPVVIRFANGAALTLNVGETTYTAELADSETSHALVGALPASVTETAPGVYAYDPAVSYTGYTAKASTIYTAPQTVLSGADGATLTYAYDLANGVKKAVVTWPAGWRYYTDEELPTRDVLYYLGDLDRDGDVDGEDLALLEAGLADPAGLTADQRLLADLDGSGQTDDADRAALAALLAGLASGELTLAAQRRVTVKERYLPADAITFDTAGLGNNAYTGAVPDAETRTVTIDLSKFDFTAGPYRVYVGGDTIVLSGTGRIGMDSAEVTARNAVTGRVVEDGYQPDGLMLVSGTLISQNRVLALTSHNGASEVRLEVAYDHSGLGLEVTRGTVASAYVSGALTELTGPLTVAPGNSVTLLMADGSVYSAELSNTGYVELSVSDVVPGAVTEANMPRLSVNGSAGGFMDRARQAIRQTMPMDASSLDDIRLHNTQSVTLARGDSFVRALQVQVNAVAAPGNGLGGTTTNPIPNDRTPYLTKVSAVTGQALAGAGIEIRDAAGSVIASGYTDGQGRLYFARPAPGSYTFREVSAPSGYELNPETYSFVVHPDGTLTGDNTIEDRPISYPAYIPEDPGIEVSVWKAWQGDEGAERPRSITVELLDGAWVYDTVTLSEDNGWHYVWTGLADRAWQVRETEVPEGYVSSVDRIGDGYVITNTYIPPEDPGIPISVEKVWQGDDDGVRPESVIIELYQGEELYDTVVLRAETGWYHLWLGLPDGDWQVREAAVPEGYISSVASVDGGFVVTNTYRKPEAPEVPQTGDSTLLYLLGALASGAALVWLILTGRRGRRRQ